MRRLIALAMLLAVAAAPAAAQTQPGEIAGHRIRVPGEVVNGTTERLSEVEADIVNGLPPQAQAEQLLQYAISRHVGATDEIKARLNTWRGKIARTDSYTTLEDMALNGADLRVRAAAIEIDLVIDHIAKTPQQVSALLQQVHANPSGSRSQIWFLGALANRGVEPARIHEEMRQLMRTSTDDQVRYQAVYAISFIGTDDTVPDLVEAFHHDPSSAVQINGGGCGLAHCGMLTRAQRMLAIPGLLEMVDDAQVNPTLMSYAFRALREITDETFGDDSRQWRSWYAAHGAEKLEAFRRFDRER